MIKVLLSYCDGHEERLSFDDWESAVAHCRGLQSRGHMDDLIYEDGLRVIDISRYKCRPSRAYLRQMDHGKQ